jgi:hypothetical protein
LLMESKPEAAKPYMKDAVQACLASTEERNGPLDPAGAYDASGYAQNECVITGFGAFPGLLASV